MDHHSVRKVGDGHASDGEQDLVRIERLAQEARGSARIAMRRSACFCSVMSRVTLAKPRSRPDLSCSAVRTTDAQKREPSLRTRSPSSVATPCSVARRSNRPGRRQSHPPEHRSDQTAGR